ncbi:DUF4845 domain-containing protein [Nitrosomonas sp.]|uniref:DUF4845 domain-containing protein n=1 Tax=Nitrosomonas sp. TaxID=42353 RepID=UPI001E02C675|nr:DUF4845 domain-containing protein [Nitrosomonas sp.]MCB1948617.1 DUF4845 domain-containing protein [Nitrosomonas sp.]MCP5242214.1 DUF4845 domain-containing protein [Burkholderiales bacterium]
MILNGQRGSQYGISLTGMMFWSVVLILVVLLGMKVAPVYIENASIKKNLAAVAGDASLQNATASQIRLAFSKRAQIDGITAITAKDIKISRDKGKNILSVTYSEKVPLFANVSLQIDFDTQSD